MKARLYKPAPVDPAAFGEQAMSWPKYRHDPRFVIAPAGTVVDDPECWRLCVHGVCAPADDECKAKVGMTDDQLYKRYQQYQKLDKGQLTGDPDKDAADPSRLAVVEN